MNMTDLCLVHATIRLSELMNERRVTFTPIQAKALSDILGAMEGALIGCTEPVGVQATDAFDGFGDIADRCRKDFPFPQPTARTTGFTGAEFRDVHGSQAG